MIIAFCVQNGDGKEAELEDPHPFNVLDLELINDHEEHECDKADIENGAHNLKALLLLTALGSIVTVSCNAIALVSYVVEDSTWDTG